MPNVTKSNPKRVFFFDKHMIVMSNYADPMGGGGLIKYHRVLSLSDLAEKLPIGFVTLESSGLNGHGTNMLCAFDKSGVHLNFGEFKSKDEDIFIINAMIIADGLFSVGLVQEYRPKNRKVFWPFDIFF